MNKKTIYALSTAFGKSGVAVFRVSGSDAKLVFDLLKMGKVPSPKVASVKKIFNKDGLLIDECLVLYFEAPKSFTGEDVVELHTHGSIAVIKALSSELALYFKSADPGEFSLRAFLNGKMTLSEVESLADLMEAETFKQIEFSQKMKLSNELYKKVHEDLISLRVFSETCIDFSEHVDETYLFSELTLKLSELLFKLSSILKTKNVEEKIRYGVNISLIGAPNSGKSTLLNYIADRNAAIVSPIAGTTRDVIEIHTNLYDYPVTIADTAGLRPSVDEIEFIGVNKSISAARTSDINIILFEYSVSPTDFVIEMVNENSLCFISKCDDFYSDDPIEISDSLMGYTLSVHSKLGIERFFTLIKQRIEHILCTASPFVLRERHVRYVKEAFEVLSSINLDSSIELISEDISYACEIFKNVTLSIASEDILDEIFSRFCIGK